MHLMARQLYAQHQPTLPPFIELRNEDERERKALSQPPGTFNVILTPDSFWQLPEYGGLIRRHWSSSGSSLSVSKFGFSEDPNLVILSEFEDTPYFMALPERGSLLHRSRLECPVCLQHNEILRVLSLGTLIEL